MAISEKKAENLIKIWERAVQTQMHFNEMSVKSRQLGFTFVAAALGAAAYTLSKEGDFLFVIPTKLGLLKIHVGLLLTLAALFAVVAIRQLDLGVYHRMLRGAVTFGEDFESNHLAKYLQLNKGMTQAISHYSRNSDANKSTVKGKYVYSGSDLKSAEEKIKRFYKSVLSLIILFALAIFLITNFGSLSTTNIKNPDQQNPTITTPQQKLEKKN